MTKFTKKAPFEFEGGRLWRNDLGGVGYIAPHIDAIPDWLAQAHHAFIEAEREGWRWTNDEKTEARNGRWVATASTDGSWWRVTHEDFSHGISTNVSPGDQCCGFQYAANVKYGDFLAWRDAQEPEVQEPTGFGYVGTITNDSGEIWDVTRDDCPAYAFDWVRRSDGDSGAGDWNKVLALGTFEPVVRP